MKIKRAEIDDLNQIMLMYSSCVNGMLLNDIDQWDETYPNKKVIEKDIRAESYFCLLYTSPSPRDRQKSRMPSSA